MKKLLLALALLIPHAAMAAGITMPIPPLTFPVYRGYSGAGDVIPNATSWYGLRGYTRASSGANAITVRRASDNTTKNIVINNGPLDIATANTFAGTDATCTGTAAASTTLALTACSSTPHAGDTLTSTGGTGSFTQPVYIVSCGAFGGGAGNCTLNTAQTVTGVAVKAQVGLFVSELFDQGGKANHAIQATAANQPQLLPSCFNGLPCLSFAGNQWLVASVCSNTGIPVFVSWILEGGPAVSLCADANAVHDNGIIAGAGPSINYFGGTAQVGVSFSQTVVHQFAMYVPFNGTMTMTVDNTATTGLNPGNTWFTHPADQSTIIGAFGPNSGPQFPQTFFMAELGTWQRPDLTAQDNNLCANQSAYYFAGSLSCTATAVATYAAVTAPCDLVTCAEAYSVTRAMTTKYTGPLFELWNGSAFLQVGQVPGTRVVDMTTWSAFCSGVQSNCKISRIYAQIQNSNNDFVAIDYGGGTIGGPATCVNSFTNCMAPFTVEVATGLPIVTLPPAGPYEYSGNGSLVNGGGPTIAPNGAGIDQVLIGIPGGTSSHSTVYNGQFAGGNECCGFFGLSHSAGGGNITASSFQLQSNNPSFGGDGIHYGLCIDAESNGTGFDCGETTATTAISYVAFMDISTGSGADMYYNGHTVFQHNPANRPVNLVSGPYIHLGGGGDLSQPAATFMREALITNNVLSATDRSNILSNETAFYSTVTFP